MVLSAHFLFLYDDRLSYEFHLQAVLELVRVAAKEVRIFPLVGLDTVRSPYVDDICDALAHEGYDSSVRQVPFEFQRGATEMLEIAAV